MDLFVCTGSVEKAIIVILLGIVAIFIGALIGVNILGLVVAAYVGVNTNKWFYEKRLKVSIHGACNFSGWFSRS